MKFKLRPFKDFAIKYVKYSGDIHIPNFDSTFLYLQNPYAFTVYAYLCMNYNINKNRSSFCFNIIQRTTGMSKEDILKAIELLKERQLIVEYKNENKEELEKFFDELEGGSFECYLRTVEDITEEELVTLVVEDGEIQNEKNNNNNKRKGQKEWSEKVRERDNNTCQCCGSKEDLYAHHLNSYDWYEQGRTDIDNGTTLCGECHRKFHNKYGYGHNTREEYYEFYKEQRRK